MKSPTLVIQWSVAPDAVDPAGAITPDQLRACMAKACQMWEPVIEGMVEFRECNHRAPPAHNHVAVEVGEVDRTTQKDRFAQNIEAQRERSRSVITLASDYRWQSKCWQTGRDYDARAVFCHEIGHVLDIPHVLSEPGNPGLVTWMHNNGFMHVLGIEDVTDWVMFAAIPILKRRFTAPEIEVYRAYFANNPNHLWKGDLA